MKIDYKFEFTIDHHEVPVLDLSDPEHIAKLKEHAMRNLESAVDIHHARLHHQAKEDKKHGVRRN